MRRRGHWCVFRRPSTLVQRFGIRIRSHYLLDPICPSYRQVSRLGATSDRRSSAFAAPDLSSPSPSSISICEFTAMEFPPTISRVISMAECAEYPSSVAFRPVSFSLLSTSSDSETCDGLPPIDCRGGRGSGRLELRDPC